MYDVLMSALRLFTFFALHNFALFSEFYHEAHGQFCAFTLFWFVFVHAVTVNCCHLADQIQMHHAVCVF